MGGIAYVRDGVEKEKGKITWTMVSESASRFTVVDDEGDGGEGLILGSSVAIILGVPAWEKPYLGICIGSLGKDRIKGTMVGGSLVEDGGRGEVATFSGKQSKLRSIDVAAYANLRGRWDYRWTERGEVSTWSKEVIGEGQRGRIDVYIVQEHDENGYENDQIWFQHDLTDGQFAVGGLNHCWPPPDEEFLFVPPLPYLLAEFQVGAKQKMAFTHSTAGSGSLTLSIKPEALTVPAGTYTDCYRVSIKAKAGKSKMTMDRWYARGVGLVKRVQDGSLWELLTYDTP